ncbi:MAG: metallophosphoesterase [Eubacteriales bacterium]|nr:metallophosphoesterase [Eubacteriales bacterium]
MKKILVMSDTHGNKTNIEKALVRFGDVDCIVHLGDYTKDVEYIKKLTNKKVYSVRGNCDVYSVAKHEIIFRAEGKKILAVHGHRQGVKTSLLRLGLYAQEKGADIALFGHTHVPAERLCEGVVLYNPGSLGEPRGKHPSVGVITIEGGTFKISSVML